jgi:CheY-like chemotaxis protein
VKYGGVHVVPAQSSDARAGDRGRRQAPDVLARGLADAGHEVSVRRTGPDGVAEALADSYDALVLDWMLPGQDGPSVCRELRARGNHTPVLMLTARNALRDRIGGLDAGADDPVERYRAQAQEIAQGATGVRLDIPAGRRDEISRLGSTLNAMLDAQERSAERQQQFIDDASHEFAHAAQHVLGRDRPGTAQTTHGR